MLGGGPASIPLESSSIVWGTADAHSLGITQVAGGSEGRTGATAAASGEVVRAVLLLSHRPDSSSAAGIKGSLLAAPSALLAEALASKQDHFLGLCRSTFLEPESWGRPADQHGALKRIWPTKTVGPTMGSLGPTTPPCWVLEFSNSDCPATVG